ncbi:PREDICTED: uncharacterized protein LOC109179736 [Ipomoea nil]|uniref:uncharacterized protein LOC109179736 n=1 Tax=Ipomoea nil TaxID=35883 RepID=UPI000900C562|nr:PREDICTED: uncharacterized protein LOC109179736 [Ipomoea nil]
MSTISWNCRGMGNPRTVRELTDLASRKKPDFIFLMETKVKRIHAERIRVSLVFDGLFNVDLTRLGGGLALLWRKNDTARLLSYSKNYIDIEVNMPSFPQWRMTCYYGFSQRHRRSEAWDLLKSFAPRSNLPWVMIGDFNDLLFQHEKRGGNPHPNSLLRGFGETIDHCGLAQLPMEGYRFTWEKGKGTPTCIEERLDKVLASNAWREIVPGARVSNNLMRKSDHSALFLSIHETVPNTRGGRRGFRFEMAWVYDEGCRGVVERSWEEGRSEGIQDCIAYCGNQLSKWGGDRYHKFGEKIMFLRKQQLHLRGRTDLTSLAEFQRLEETLSNMEIQEDTYWRQRAKQHWLKNADANTKFYHMYASHRKKKNTIYKLMNDNGDWMEGDNMNTIILEYFSQIFSSGDPIDGNDLFSEISPRVTQTQNDQLLRPFVITEVRDALFAMAPDKAPGPDGMNPGFYQHFWDVVGNDISAFILNCLNNQIFPADLNNTDVVLIPKKKSPEVVADFRPIALSNVIYRIMAKMITQRMKPLMENIISNSQSAFIPDRLITDNILVAAEVGHYLNRKQCGAVGWGALKLDMAKAYDRMEWPFLRGMLIALGFDDRWIDLIMLCVTTVSYNFMINGSRSTPITPTRGLRQGDPLSPYLFIICAEGLSVLLQRAQDKGLIHGCRVARGAPPISHLFFADDSLLFFRANMQEASEIKNCLLLYESLSGQKDYPLLWEGIKRLHLHILRIGSGKGLVLGIRNYYLRQAMNRYWWGTGTDRGIHWKAWDGLCIPKKHGGLGFKDLRAFNLAMLGKQAWRLLTNTDSLVAKVYKARYYPRGSFLEATMGNNPSFCWRSIMAAKDLVCGGIRRRIGNGKSTLIWEHPWLQDELDPMIHTEMPQQLSGTRVVGLIDQDTETWDPHILTDIFQPSDIPRIQKIPVAPDYDDIWYWYDDPNGIYSVKSGYRRIVAAILYHIWRTRNGVVWDACLPRPTKVLTIAMATMKAWKEVHHRAPSRLAAQPATAASPNTTVGPPPPGDDTADIDLPPPHAYPPGDDTANVELPPPHAYQPELPHGAGVRPVKCYVDASYNHGTNVATIGAVLFDADGNYMSAFNAPY